MRPFTADGWDPSLPGVMRLPSGRLVRGRGLSRPRQAGPAPDFGLYLLGHEPPAVAWESRWLVWPDFRLPADRSAAVVALHEVWTRAGTGRVEVACAGGRGRSGTALACIAVIDGVPPGDAVAYARAHYHPDAVETFGQYRFVAHFPGSGQ